MAEAEPRGDEIEVRSSPMPPASPTIFGSSEPRAIVEKMGEVAEVLVAAIQTRGLARRYGDAERDFLHIEAWQFLGSMLEHATENEGQGPVEDPGRMDTDDPGVGGGSV